MMSKLEFDCKLAHRREIKKVSGFNSIKELYVRVSQTFEVPLNEILFCTLNTHDFRNMNSLLGNYLSLGDLIVVHMCGSGKDLSLKKTQEYLGLTITDNGQGRAFVKKVKSDEGVIEEMIKPGDHIAAINAESTVGMRHYEVAKAIREVPEQTTFTLHLIQPLCSNENQVNQSLKTDLNSNSFTETRTGISVLNLNEIKYANPQRTMIESNTVSLSNCILPDTSHLNSSYEDLANSSLPIDRLLSKGTNNMQLNKDSSVSNGHDSYRSTIEKINSILESFLGINDNLLAIQIYRMAKENKDSFESFAEAIKNSELGVFSFDEDIETYLWNCAIAVV